MTSKQAKKVKQLHSKLKKENRLQEFAVRTRCALATAQFLPSDLARGAYCQLTALLLIISRNSQCLEAPFSSPNVPEVRL